MNFMREPKMGSDLPVHWGDLSYDNAKVRRRSSFKKAVQTGLANGVGRNCCTCSIGRILFLVLVLGIGYVAVTHTAPLQKNGKDGSKNRAVEVDLLASAGRGKWNTRYKDVSSGLELKEEVSNGSRTESVDQLNMEEQLWRNRQAEVVAAFRHAWKGYRDYAMGFDELKPMSKTGVDGLGGLGATIVDSIDTAIIMGCDDIVKEAATWIERELPTRFKEQGQVNLFETTIRVLGGLLSAFHLLEQDSGLTKRIKTSPEVFLNIAIDLGDRLYSAFADSPTAVPYSDVILSAKKAHPAYNDGGASSTAEATSVQMEFWFLSQLSGDDKYGKAAMHVIEHIRGLQKEQGLVPIFISPHSGQFFGNNIRLGSRGDSYYEYLLKVWLLRGGVDNDASPVAYLRDMYEEAISGVKNLLVKKSQPNGLVYVGELPSGAHGSFSPKMDHLVCFLAGTLAVGATRGLSKEQALRRGFMNEKDLYDLDLAEALCHTCYQMYAVTATGLAPEIAYFNMDGRAQPELSGGRQDAFYADDVLIHTLDRHNLLRPETVESLFALYRVTGKSKYREWGYSIFKAFEAHTKIHFGGYSSLQSVTQVPPPKRDKMETFFLGETLKYLYLLFGSPSHLPLDQYVFNTEAHPLPVLHSHIQSSVPILKANTTEAT